MYRRELLSRLGLAFDVFSPDLDETPEMGELPRALALRLAGAKAHAVAKRHPKALVIGSDQVVDLDGRCLGKPGHHAAALSQLQAMRGRTVVFQTAVSVVCTELGFEATEITSVSVKFRHLEDDEIERYLLRERPYDCAGSAKSESLGIALVDSIESDDPTALVGLPMIRTCALLRRAGVKLF